MFRFSHALYFAAFMTGVLILSRWLSDEYGESGALLTSFFAALAELHASVASLGQLLEQGGISISGVRHAFLGVLGASVISRSIAAWVAGGAAYGVRVAVGLSVAWIAAALTIGFASH